MNLHFSMLAIVLPIGSETLYSSFSIKFLSFWTCIETVFCPGQVNFKCDQPPPTSPPRHLLDFLTLTTVGQLSAKFCEEHGICQSLQQWRFSIFNMRVEYLPIQEYTLHYGNIFQKRDLI